MVDIERKLENVEKICLESAKKENVILKNENDTVCEENVSKMVEEYKKELDKKYRAELNKLDRELNKNMFNSEMEQRIKINSFKESLVNNINLKVVQIISEFVDSDEYRGYLFECIDKTITKIQAYGCNVYLTNRDYDRFAQEVENKFKVTVLRVDDNKIGGCIVENMSKKVMIDNTLLNNIEEKVKKIIF